MKTIFSLVAEGVVNDSRTNNVSIFNMLSQLAGPSLPFFVQKMVYFALIEIGKDDKSNKSYDLNLVVKNNKNTLLEHNLRLNFQGKKRNRQIVEIGGLGIPSPGNVSFTLSWGNKKLSKYSIDIVKTGQASVEDISN
ncbi:MAG: hypothetical protein KMY53_00135 [Desulfarculus sp.]|nr:hypothetical protein [Pseudomonadota bacterium]MBV1716968.1 hypothetical protein [Desulfarculus sp.]MBU4575474.1 hypothetical protein [Pseudomonadota bacterium]MBU4597591.1 hypothetical protein [Pseudomonadota bacterium]MBV1736544.1 hypothetical protein [Desulfarculus sp.]